MEYKVSKQTAELVKAYDLVSEVYSCGYGAMCKRYPEKKALEILDGEFTESIKNLEKAIFNLIAITITENRGRLKSDEI